MDLRGVYSDLELGEEVREYLLGDDRAKRERIGAILDAEGFHDPRNVEAIVRMVGRPALLVQNGSFVPPVSKVWRKRLDTARKRLEKAIGAVGRVEIKNHDDLSWAGTGWLVGSDVVITNRHVAREFCQRDGKNLAWRTSLRGRRMGARIDLKEEHDVVEEEELDVVELLYLADPDEPDVALLRVEENDIAPIELQAEPKREAFVATIGYPARDSRRNDAEMMRRIFADIYDVKRLQPGRIQKVEGEVFTHDCSTLGGNSGSVVLDLDSGRAAGLHFAGRYKVANYAVPSPVLLAICEEYLG